MTGIMDGVSQISSGTMDEKWGYVSQSGTTIELNDSPGGESISLIHHSGAAIKIDPDGAIHLVSSSKKGIGISAPYGDAYLSASGEIIIKGSSLNFNTSGDANFDIGGTFNLVCGGYKLSTNVLDEKVDGSASREVTNDLSEIIGGISRSTIAGDKRTQISGNEVKDVGGDHIEKITGNSVLNTKGNKTIQTTGETLISSIGNLTENTNGDFNMSSTGALNTKAGGNATHSASGNNKVIAGGAMDVSGGSSLDLVSPISKLSGSSYASVEAPLAELVGDTAKVGGSSVYLNTPTVYQPTPIITSGNDSPAIGSVASALSPDSAEEATEADVMEANDIVDNMTSIRKYPKFPGNATRDSADGGSVYTVSHDYTDSADEVYKEYSSKNHGNINPATPIGDYGNIPDVSPANRKSDIKGIDPKISVPGAHNSSSKISRLFTLGDLTNAKHSHKIPPSIRKAVVTEHIYAAYNVLDPIKEKFPDIIITSAYRGNSRNHKTGKAIDMVVPSRSLEKHAEIAAFARDNLPIDQVFLERNTSGRTHVHVRVSHSPATPFVMTCADPACHTNIKKLSVEYLRKKGVK
ncbi:MAG: hypothetical protein COA52_00820 [Hyphomicrobiales bacterium]|nr:MAG: hypothetical protein COA52_00820 [Hyphomicrobiales bacterium]